MNRYITCFNAKDPYQRFLSDDTHAFIALFAWGMGASMKLTTNPRAVWVTPMERGRTALPRDSAI
jgi:hypothetical protein